MKLTYVVLTSVTRDDLPDGGASQFVRTIKQVRKSNSRVIMEVLIPDFEGSEGALNCLLDASPEVVNHNLETVPRLYPKVRPQADYLRSLTLLKKIKEHPSPPYTKSGLMVGLGERMEEVLNVMSELRKCDCDFLTIGQYLRPSFNHHPIIRHVSEEEFDRYRKSGEEMGFKAVFSSRLVRSSFMAGEFFKKAVHGY
jgi:lipoic acid synthetase